MALRWVVVGMSVSLSAQVAGDSWPGFRGATGAGVSSERKLPVVWSIDTNLAWRVPLPGRANSSPVVVAGRVFVTTQKSDHSLWVIGVRTEDGTKVFEKEVGSGEVSAKGPRNLYAHRHNAATPTPVADEERVWSFFGTGLLVCLSRNGELKWERDLAQEYGEYDVQFGMASSPRLWGDVIFIMCIHKGPSYVVAIDKKTGDEVWKVERTFEAAADGKDGYATPTIYERGDRTELLVAGADHVNAYDPRSGRQLWVSGGLAVNSTFGRVIASPATSGDDVLVICSGNPQGGVGHALGIKAGGDGDVTKSHRLWKFGPGSPDSPTPVCYGGRVYMIKDNGVGFCLDLKSGEKVWERRLGKGPYRASAIAGDGKIYALSRDGVCSVIKATPSGEIIATNELEGTFFATPAISDSTLYLRSHDSLYAVRQTE